MKPYTRNDDKGRTRAGDDIHRRTADIPRELRDVAGESV